MPILILMTIITLYICFRNGVQITHIKPVRSRKDKYNRDSLGQFVAKDNTAVFKKAHTFRVITRKRMVPIYEGNTAISYFMIEEREIAYR